MQLDKLKTEFIKQLILRAAKLPSIFLITGMLLIGLVYIDNIFPITEFKQLFELTDKIGNIFLTFSVLTFVYKFIVLLLKHQERNLYEQHRVASLILSSIRKGLRIITLLAAIDITIILIGPNKFYLLLANDIIKTIIIGSIGWIAIQILYTFEAIIYQQMKTLTKKDARRIKALYTKTHIMRNIATVIIILLTIAIMLLSFKGVRNIGISLLASAGFLTAIVGLAAQKAISSLFSGIQIALSQPIKIGDIVVVNNESGTIEEITFTYVILNLGDSRRLIVPIHYFLDNNFENWSHNPDGMQTNIKFNVDYLMPIQPLREHLNAILSASKNWDGQLNKLQVSALTEKSVELRISISAESSDELSELRSEIREKMLDFIRDNYAEYFPAFRINKYFSSEESSINNFVKLPQTAES